MSEQSSPHPGGSECPTPTPGTSGNGQANAFAILEMNGYKVGRSIGKGSYATVKEAHSVKHKTKVAIKIISKKKAPKDYLHKFLPREIEVVKLLKHPNLITSMQCIETTNRVYLIMECATGGDLLEVIRTRKTIPEPQAATWFSQMLAGIEYCHNLGVVHRDLKCENVLLDKNENIKITDFGFARPNMNAQDGQSPPLSETYCGSYAYAPPEILTGTPYVPQLADIWSIGVILYVMVVGRLPFDDSNHRELLRQVRRGPAFSDKRPVSVDCKQVIIRILTKREDRASITHLRQMSWYRRLAPSTPSNPVPGPSRRGSTSSRKKSIDVSNEANQKRKQSLAKDKNGSNDSDKAKVSSVAFPTRGSQHNILNYMSSGGETDQAYFSAKSSMGNNRPDLHSEVD